MFRQFLAILESGEKSASELVRLCLERIAAGEPQLQAWVETRPLEPLADGPLHGMPFGVKDIFETRVLATEFGSPVYAGRKGQADSALVEHLRQAGGTLLGKTRTTAFAYLDPAPTRNPRAPGRTPGGSSSGSAAAVAAGTVPFALGTQTQGSVIRPASFCGIVGLKPTFDLLPITGALPFAPSLDTAGLFTQTAADMALLWQRGFAGHVAEAVRMGLADSSLAPLGERLRAAGFAVESLDLPESFPELLTASRLINAYEGARSHQERWRKFGDAIGRKLAELVASGLKISEDAYREAHGRVAEMRCRMSAIFREFPVVLTRAAPGPPPEGLESTGDSRCNAPWTALGTPAITVPLNLANGLPLGLQMLADHHQEPLLLGSAVAVEPYLADSISF